jgi:hypothetical protein
MLGFYHPMQVGVLHAVEYHEHALPLYKPAILDLIMLQIGYTYVAGAVDRLL